MYLFSKSSNGTFVNALKLTPEVERELRFGDVIGMGISNEQDDSAIEPNDERAFIYRFIKVPYDYNNLSVLIPVALRTIFVPCIIGAGSS